jgi:hypothetical protein
MPTLCGAPTSFFCQTTIEESAVIVQWSGATNGTDNTINGYDVQYSNSDDNKNWGVWATIGTINSTSSYGTQSISISALARGTFRRYQIRTRGTAGSSYFSGYIVSSNSVQRNTIPTPPPQISAYPSAYMTETVTLSWSGTVAGAGGIAGYMVASRTSTNNSAWTSWDVIDEFIATTNTSHSYAPSITRNVGTYTQFGVWTIDKFDLYSIEGISNSIYCGITNCGAPAAFSVSPVVAETTSTLSWSGASGGTNNEVSSYEIENSDSKDGTYWGAWTSYGIMNTSAASYSLTVSSPDNRGDFRRYRIRTRGAAGASYYSDWKISSNNLRKNILPIAPTTFTAENPVSNFVSLEFSGTTKGTSAIASYLIQMSKNSAGTWGAWANLETLNGGDTSGGISLSIPDVSVSVLRFRICVTDALGGVSDYAYSNIVGKHSPPPAPLVESPKNAANIYNLRPRYLLQTAAHPDGFAQTLNVLAADGKRYNSVDNAEMFSVSGTWAGSVRTVFTNPQSKIGASEIKVRADDMFDNGAEISRFYNIISADFPEITANVTRVRVEHILSLREAVNNVRNFYNLTVVPWRYPLVSGKTNIAYWSYHIIEIRNVINGIVNKINSWSGVQLVAPVEWIALGNGRPRADVMRQIWEVIMSL